MMDLEKKGRKELCYLMRRCAIVFIIYMQKWYGGAGSATEQTSARDAQPDKAYKSSPFREQHRKLTDRGLAGACHSYQGDRVVRNTKGCIR